MLNSEQKLFELIRKGEGIDLEFKACRDQLNRDVYETVCAFLNRHGGTLFLGVKDSGEVQGISTDAISQIRKDFATTINNPQKITPPTYLSISEIAIEGKQILHIFVPESSQVHRCNGRIYDRNEDGDLDITDHTTQVDQLYQRKQTTYSENKVYPYAGLEELETDLIAKCRKIATLRRQDHPWGTMNDLDLIKSAQLYQTDPETGKSGVTRAGLLLLGKRSPLLSAVPHHRTDLILRKVNLDRYDDRDFIDVNLVESYERIMAFVHKHLPDPFYLEGTTSISIRDAIFREVASNILIHREYTNAFPAKLIIEQGLVRTENSNRPHGFGILKPETFTPFPKNPVIASFFREIGRADELGSGMRKMMRYGRAYGGSDPEMIEGDVFRSVVKVPEFGTSDGGQVSPPLVPEQVTQQVTQQVEKLLEKTRGEMSRAELMAELSLKDRVNFTRNYLEPALADELIEMTQPDSPQSPTQKYRLTEKGRSMLERKER
jgi:ATP-dependent DNA helicase RecG